MKREIWSLAAVMVVVLLLALPVLTYPLARDQGEFATLGRGLLDGRVPYRDLWNPKPPAVFYVFAGAMALFGQTAAALRAIDLLLFVPVAILLWRLAGRLGPRPLGTLAVLMFGAYYFTESFWTLTQNDGIAILFMLLAADCLLRAEETGRLRWLFAAGLWSGVVLWFKYPFVLFVLALGIDYAAHVIQRARERGGPIPMRAWGQAAAAFAAGAGLVVAGGVLYYAALGALDELIESALLTARYTALGTGAASFEEATVLRGGLMERWRRWWLLLVLAVGWWLLPGRGRVRGPWRLVWLWALAAIGIVAIQGKGYDYHFLPLLVPLILIGGESLLRLAGGTWTRFQRACLLRRLSRERWLKMSSGMIAAGLVLALIGGVWVPAWGTLTGREGREDYLARFRGGEFLASESEAAVDYLRARTTPGDSLFIWGFRAEVYYLTGLRPATRFIFNFPLVADWYPHEWRQQTVDTLWAALPPYVLVLRGDYMPWTTGLDADSNTLLQEFTELNNWLMYNYTLETEIGLFLVWRRNDR